MDAVTFVDIVHELSRARRDWATTFLWNRAFHDKTDGQAKAAADEACIERLTHAEARYQIALSAIQHGYSIDAELRRHGLANDPGDDTHQEPDLSNPDPEAATQDCGD